MKKSIFLVVVLYALQGFAQGEVNNNNNTLAALAVNGANNFGNSSIVISPPKPVEGSVHVYDSWNNNAIITSSEGQRYRIRNINFNVDRNVFESQIGKDSVFTFDFTNLDKIELKNREYKNVFSPVDGGYRVFEVVAETDDFAIYKDYYLEIKAGSDNPMLIQRNDRYILKDRYFAKRGRSFKKFKMRKSAILKLMGKKADALEAFAKENDLDFDDEKDLKRIAEKYSSM